MLEEMDAFFNSRAERYDIVHTEHIDGGIESKNVIASFLHETTKSILDLGIGTGLELDEIFNRFPNIKVTGVDIAEDMLRQITNKYPGKNIDLHCKSYFNYDFGIRVYDAVLSVMTLHHYDHAIKTDLYRKIYNCISEGGMYIECDYMLHEDEYPNAQETEDYYFSEYERLKNEQGINDNKEYHYDTPCTVSNQREKLLKAGFTNVREVWRRKNTVILVADK